MTVAIVLVKVEGVGPRRAELVVSQLVLDRPLIRPVELLVQAILDLIGVHSLCYIRDSL